MAEDASYNPGDGDAAGESPAGLPAESLLPLVYAELRALASARMRSLAKGQTLQPTALVHEAYARLVGRGRNKWQNVGHFYHSAARAMHDILVEDARRKATVKRGGQLRRKPLDSASLGFESDPASVLALSEAIDRLKAKSHRQYQLVMLRCFAGLTLEESAETMGVSERTVRRDWQYVRARLHSELKDDVVDDRESDA